MIEIDFHAFIRSLFIKTRVNRIDWEEFGFGSQLDFAPWDYDFQSNDYGRSEMLEAIDREKHNDENRRWKVTVISNPDTTHDYYSYPPENEKYLQGFLDATGIYNENTK